MDTAEMIEERKLRQGFVLATLISTVAGTFITGINLYDRIVEQRRQKKLDRGQNKRIKELEQRLNEAEDEKKRIKQASQADTGANGNTDLRTSLERSGDVVQREFDRYLASLGPRFAKGDLIAQTQLQSQIILLQGSVIRLLEEALLTGTLPDLTRLYNTSEFAREGSLRALRDQYQRMLQAASPPRRPPGPIRRTSSTPSLRDSYVESTWGGRRRPKELAFGNRAPLFCPYATDVQRTDRTLESCVAVERSSAVCAACGATVDAGDETGGFRAWRIEKEVAVREEGTSEAIVARAYLLTRRFVFKCHRRGEGAGYACYLCARHRDWDTLCRSEEGLVSHVTSKHSIREYEGDRDIKALGQTSPNRQPQTRLLLERG